LPVVNDEGELEGILSMNDVVLHATADAGEDTLEYGEVIKTYHAICEHPKPLAASATPAA
jgi:CBS domain-containing protein